jgi:VWFA-related protein
MIRARFASVLAVWTAFLTITAGAGRPDLQAPAPQATFRGGANAVTVDVTVRDRNRRAITDLKADDFEVSDNGVRQQVDSVSYGKLPIDITVALDVSYSVTGELLERLRQAVVQLMRDLGREDRLKLLLFNMRASRSVDFTNDVRAVEKAVRAAAAGGSTSLLDAVSIALVTRMTPDRRHLVVFFTDATDSTSTTTPEALRIVAQRTRATLTLVIPAPIAPVTVIQSGGGAASRTPPGTTTTPTTITTSMTSRGLQLTPPSPLEPFFNLLTRETGGTVLRAATGADLSATFRRVLEDFRSAYVLYYNARGVDRGGFHELEVKVRREGATILARRGYWN